jgi:hypothetical protein
MFLISDLKHSEICGFTGIETLEAQDDIEDQEVRGTLDVSSENVLIFLLEVRSKFTSSCEHKTPIVKPVSCEGPD